MLAQLGDGAVQSVTGFETAPEMHVREGCRPQLEAWLPSQVPLSCNIKASSCRQHSCTIPTSGPSPTWSLLLLAHGLVVNRGQSWASSLPVAPRGPAEKAIQEGSGARNWGPDPSWVLWPPPSIPAWSTGNGVARGAAWGAVWWDHGLCKVSTVQVKATQRWPGVERLCHLPEAAQQ